VPTFGVAVPLCLMWRALVGEEGATNSGTTIGPGTPAGARWMWPAMNVSWARLLIWVLNVIVPSSRTLISVWPLAADVEPVVSFFAVILACRTHIVPLPLFAGATLMTGQASRPTRKANKNTPRMTFTLRLASASTEDQ